MHLLALGAFWPVRGPLRSWLLVSLNAPFGARCFLAPWRVLSGLFAPHVLMHLLALGAFWQKS